MQIAVIDMGTNTFNLLVATTAGRDGFEPLYHSKIGVMLGKGGINSHVINPDAYARAINAISDLLVEVDKLGGAKVKAYATSAIRSAANGQQLINEIKEQFGVDVEVISGDREAELIYKGVNQSLKMGSEKHLLMDIGGGSNEFIICNSSSIFWKQSFPLGVSRLLERFSPSDPILNTEIVTVENFLRDGLEPLWRAVKEHSPKVLVGSSGTFDTYRDVIFYGSDSVELSKELGLEPFKKLHYRLLSSTLEQRRCFRGMDELRVEMIVLASILTNLVLDITNISTVIQSNFALKEGAIVELLTNVDEN